jgi:enamine deaminase RidA (YjgF/YER057c/UK114 family)
MQGHAADPRQRKSRQTHSRVDGLAHLRSVGFVPSHPTRGKPMASDTQPTPLYDRLNQLGIVLPPVAAPAAAYVPFVRSGNLLFLSGHLAKRDGKVWVGQLGRDMITSTGKLAARAIAIDLLGTLHAALGDLNKVERIVKVMSLVNSSPDFTEHHLVTNGCSELLAEVFGDKGAHARSAFGVAQIPLGACVEIELIAQVA